MESKHICLWSGPRNISTALMYSFAQRNDTIVVDEPLYAHYLIKSGTADYHPGSQAVIQSQENDGEKVVAQMLKNTDSPIYFYKQMAHHLVKLDLSFLSKTTNIILTREPNEMISSYVKVIPNPSISDLGYQQQLNLINKLLRLGQHPIIVDSKSILQNPSEGLKRLCNMIKIPFQEEMLKWKVGPRIEDGIWAKYWYENVHNSSGFEPYKKKIKSIPSHLMPLLLESERLFEEIKSKSISL
ncbi:sulfotransferase family protein [Salibacteraceae bacterium]|nr:sulfotransferase family protein [Salibacteraceae bacterium]